MRQENTLNPRDSQAGLRENNRRDMSVDEDPVSSWRLVGAKDQGVRSQVIADVNVWTLC